MDAVSALPLCGSSEPWPRYPGRSTFNVVCVVVPGCDAPLKAIVKCAKLAARALDLPSSPVDARA